MTLFCVYLLTFLVGIFSFKVFKKFYTDKKNRINLTRLNFLSLTLIYCFSFLGMGVLAFAYRPLISAFSLCVFAVLSLLVAYFSVRPFSGKIQMLMDYLLCALGTMLIVPNEFVLTPSFYGLLFLTSVFWLLGWHLIRFFDQFPFVSFVMSCVWAIGLILAGQVVSQIPAFFLASAGLVGILGFVCFRKRLSLLLTGFGFQSASLIGFFWAGVWAYFFLRGHYLPAVTLYSYYIMELFVLVGCVLMQRPMVPLFLKALQVHKMGGKAVRTLFGNMLLITLLSLFVMFFKNSAMLFLVLSVCFILYYLVSRLKNLPQSAPRYRDVLLDVKNGFKELYSQTKKTMNNKTLEKKTKTPQKKKSVKTTKKKVKGKKKK